MEEFEREFLSGFAWLLLRRYVGLELETDGSTKFVGAMNEIADDLVRSFPSSAQFAFLSIRDSLHEVSHRVSGKGMDQIFAVLNSRVPAGELLLAIQRVTEEQNATGD